MTARRRTRAAGLLLVLWAGLALGVALAGPAGADEPGPAYPPGEDAQGVVEAGRGDPATDGTGTSDGSDAAGQDEPGTGSGAGEGGAAGTSDEQLAVDGQAASDRGAPGDDGRGVGPYLVVLGTAILLAGAVTAIARRL